MIGNHKLKKEMKQDPPSFFTSLVKSSGPVYNLQPFPSYFIITFLPLMM